jgi:putative addiction module component (TIGR02574 family)
MIPIWKEVNRMNAKAEELAKKIDELPDAEKAMLVDVILAKLDQPDREMDKIWAEEAAKRWAAYQEGRLKALSYDEVMARYRKR